MVSGFFTSPHDHERIRSGEASEILIASKFCGWDCWLNRFRRSFIYLSPEGANSFVGQEERERGPGNGEQERVCRNPCSPFPVPASPFFQLHVDRQRADF